MLAALINVVAPVKVKMLQKVDLALEITAVYVWGLSIVTGADQRARYNFQIRKYKPLLKMNNYISSKNY
jgi:hypothetical protein